MSAARLACQREHLNTAGPAGTQDTDLKYCYLAKAAYDAYDHGRCRYSLDRMLPALGLGDHGYVATAFLYAAVNIVPVEHQQHWIGYVAVADKAERDRVLGYQYREIVVVWRGTSALDELFKDLEANLQPIHGDESNKLVLVENGIQSLYATSCDSDACKNNQGNNKLSAKDQVLAELRRLVTYLRNKCPGDKIHVTATGHSLGGALATLTAWDAAAHEALAGVVVRAVTFGAPRVGNQAFCDELVGPRGVKVHRVIVDRDVVPSLPPTSFGYADAGGDVRLLDSKHVVRLPFLTLLVSWHFHSLKEYLRILDSDYHERPVQVQDPPPVPADQFLRLPEAELDKRICRIISRI
jgi:hypothetical protein